MLDAFCAGLIQVLSLYLTAAIMAIGFGLMVAGGRGVSAVAEFFFARPFLALLSGIGHLIALAAKSLVQVVSAGATVIVRDAIDPTLKLIGRGLKRLLFPRRR